MTITPPTATPMRRLTVFLPYDAHAPRTARRYATRWLAAEAGGTRRAADAVLIVSELVANAVHHARGPCVLTLTMRGTLLDIGVADESEDLPERRSVPGERGGFGLALVALLGDAVTVVPALGGKTVHVTLDTEAATP
ncbi:ATP-binding protein [Streptomyces sp. NPDC101213]|uniref:ATP-binding protein n=1 Tax=Streptomyces sp. NPDC101213 TaxID=3366130 RepID=UPI003817C6F3